MAQQGSGLGKGPDGSDMTDPTGYNARSGAAKQTQKTFEQSWGMKDMTKLSGIAPSDPGTGPVANSPNPLDGIPIRNEDGDPPKTSWGMKGTVDHALGGRVLGEAILSGAATLPSGESYSKSGPGKP